MGKYRPPEPAKYGTEFSETNRFGQNSPPPAAAQPGQAQLQSQPVAAGANNGPAEASSLSGAHLLELAGALLVLCLVAHVDAGNGGKGLLNPSVLFLFWVALATFFVRAW